MDDAIANAEAEFLFKLDVNIRVRGCVMKDALKRRQFPQIGRHFLTIMAPPSSHVFSRVYSLPDTETAQIRKTSVNIK